MNIGFYAVDIHIVYGQNSPHDVGVDSKNYTVHTHATSIYLNTRLACAEAEFLDEIQTKVLRVFLLAIHSELYSFVLRCLFLQTHTSS